jgi:hypothetical protein
MSNAITLVLPDSKRLESFLANHNCDEQIIKRQVRFQNAATILLSEHKFNLSFELLALII